MIGKKVKIIYENYDPNQMNLMFSRFLEDSKGKIFTVGQEKKYKGTDIYILKEEPTWLFYGRNLEIVE